jgi:hypothetical protein
MSANILSVNQEELYTLYEFTINNGDNIVAFGPIGVGKTEIAKQAIESSNHKCIYLNLSVLEAPDFVGIPHIKGDRSSWALPEFLPLSTDTQEKYVFLLDEIDKIQPELQFPLLELFQYRTINDQKINVQAIIATGNRLEDKTFSRPVSQALTNRCRIFNVKTRFSVWVKWARENNVNPLILGFLDNNREFFSSPTSGDEEYCVQSPRSWTLAASDLDKASDFSVDWQYKIVAGRVGIDAATMFKLWLEYLQEAKSDIDKLISDGKSPDISNKSEDYKVVAAIDAVSRITKTYREKLDKDQSIKVAGLVFNWLSELPSAYVVAAIKSSIDFRMIKTLDLMELDEVNVVFDKIDADLEGYTE